MYLAKENLDDLVTLLTKARVVNRLLDFMPPSKRSLDDFNTHFKAAGMGPLVEWNTRREVRRAGGRDFQHNEGLWY